MAAFREIVIAAEGRWIDSHAIADHVIKTVPAAYLTRVYRYRTAVLRKSKNIGADVPLRGNVEYQMRAGVCAALAHIIFAHRRRGQIEGVAISRGVWNVRQTRPFPGQPKEPLCQSLPSPSDSPAT